MNISDRIHDLRKAKGISQEELADSIGVSRQAVSKWESDQSVPDIGKIILLSEYFDTTTDYLLRGIETVNQAERKPNAALFSIGGTAVNAVGLVCAVTIWLERQMAYSIGVGLIFMLFGTMFFLIGQVSDCTDQKRARRYFLLPNVWILLLMPMSCCFNILSGLAGGFLGMPAPIPQLGNSFKAFMLFWAAYLILCAALDLVILCFKTSDKP